MNEATYEHSKFMVDKFSQMPYFENFRQMCIDEFKKLKEQNEPVNR